MTTTVRRSVSVVVAMLLTAALVATTAAPADAWEYTKRRGGPGKVFLNPVVVTDQMVQWSPLLTFSAVGPRVRRTRNSRAAQDVNAIYTIQRWNPNVGKWQFVTRHQTYNRIPRGRTATRVPGFYLQPNTAVGYFRVLVTFTWWKAGTQQRLAIARVRPNLTTDFRCGTDQRPCQPHAGSVRVGRHRMLGGGW
jgi:hypothetical protein